MQELWSAWLADAATRGVFTPVSNHDCAFFNCPKRKIPLYYCKDGRICMGPSPPTMGWLNGNIVYFPRGGQPPCDQPRHNRPVPPGMSSVYFCVATGTPHFCGEECDRTHSDGTIVCMLTGQVIEMTRVTKGRYGDPDKLINRVPKDTKELTDVNLATRALEFTGNMEHLPRMEKTFESFWSHTLIRVTAIMSPQRFEHEEREMLDRSEALHTCLERHIENHRQPVDMLQLLLIAAQHRQKFASTPKINMNEDVTNHLALHYASIVIALWGVLRTLVPGGEQMTKRRAYKDFIIVALELYKTGIGVRDRFDLYDVELLSPDPILTIVGISEHAKDIALTKRVSNKNIARLRKGILSVLQEAVTLHSVSPELLRIAEIVPKIDQFPPEVFD